MTSTCNFVCNIQINLNSFNVSIKSQYPAVSCSGPYKLLHIVGNYTKMIRGVQRKTNDLKK